MNSQILICNPVRPPEVPGDVPGRARDGVPGGPVRGRRAETRGRLPPRPAAGGGAVPGARRARRNPEGTLIRVSKMGKLANCCKFLAGSFSAVSKRNFARKYAFDSIFQALQDLHTFAPLQSQNFSKNRFEKSAIFVKIQRRFCKSYVANSENLQRNMLARVRPSSSILVEWASTQRATCSYIRRARPKIENRA